MMDNTEINKIWTVLLFITLFCTLLIIENNTQIRDLQEQTTRLETKIHDMAIHGMVVEDE